MFVTSAEVYRYGRATALNGEQARYVKARSGVLSYEQILVRSSVGMVSREGMAGGVKVVG